MSVFDPAFNQDSSGRFGVRKGDNEGHVSARVPLNAYFISALKGNYTKIFGSKELLKGGYGPLGDLAKCSGLWVNLLREGDLGKGM
jgi:hypothetical protein